eukprot:COSAG02_NODE_2605_length_8442_cov_9.552080_7_plen_78_part_00
MIPTRPISLGVCPVLHQTISALQGNRCAEVQSSKVARERSGYDASYAFWRFAMDDGISSSIECTVQEATCSCRAIYA